MKVVVVGVELVMMLVAMVAVVVVVVVIVAATVGLHLPRLRPSCIWITRYFQQ